MLLIVSSRASLGLNRSCHSDDCCDNVNFFGLLSFLALLPSSLLLFAEMTFQINYLNSNYFLSFWYYGNLIQSSSCSGWKSYKKGTPREREKSCCLWAYTTLHQMLGLMRQVHPPTCFTGKEPFLWKYPMRSTCWFCLVCSFIR